MCDSNGRAEPRAGERESLLCCHLVYCSLYCNIRRRDSIAIRSARTPETRGIGVESQGVHVGVVFCCIDRICVLRRRGCRSCDSPPHVWMRFSRPRTCWMYGVPLSSEESILSVPLMHDSIKLADFYMYRTIFTPSRNRHRGRAGEEPIKSSSAALAAARLQSIDAEGVPARRSSPEHPRRVCHITGELEGQSTAEINYLSIGAGARNVRQLCSAAGLLWHVPSRACGLRRAGSRLGGRRSAVRLSCELVALVCVLVRSVTLCRTDSRCSSVRFVSVSTRVCLWLWCAASAASMSTEAASRCLLAVSTSYELYVNI